MVLGDWRCRCGWIVPVLGPHPGGPVTPGHPAHNAGGTSCDVGEVRVPTGVTGRPQSLGFHFRHLSICFHHQLLLPVGCSTVVTSVEKPRKGVYSCDIRGAPGSDGPIRTGGMGQSTPRCTIYKSRVCAVRLEIKPQQ